MKIKGLLSLILIAALTACGNKTASDEHGHEKEGAKEVAQSGEIVFSPEQAKAAGVETEVCTASQFASVIRASGEITADQSSESAVVAPSSGIVSLNGIYSGSPVKQGAKIASVSAKAIADGDPAERARIEYERASKEFQRAGELVGSNIVSRKDYDDAAAAYRTAKARYEALQPDGAGGVAVKSPRNGYVSECLVSNGEYVTTGQIMFRVASNGKMTLTAYAPVAEYSQLNGIRSANFTVPYDESAFSLDALHGTLKAVGRAVEGSAYVPVTFTMNAVPTIPTGTAVEVYLIGAPHENTLSVPVSAITEEQGVYFVYIRLDADCYRKQAVTLGATNGIRTEITSGLKEGDNVVTAGVYQVKLAAVSSIIPEGHTHNH